MVWQRPELSQQPEQLPGPQVGTPQDGVSAIARPNPRPASRARSSMVRFMDAISLAMGRMQLNQPRSIAYWRAPDRSVTRRDFSAKTACALLVLPLQDQPAVFSQRFEVSIMSKQGEAILQCYRCNEAINCPADGLPLAATTTIHRSGMLESLRKNGVDAFKRQQQLPHFCRMVPVATALQYLLDHDAGHHDWASLREHLSQ